MRFLAVVLLAASPALLAQRVVSPSGFGRILFPGGQPTPGGTVSGPGRIAFPGGIPGGFPGGFPGGVPPPSYRQGPIGAVWTTAPLNPPRNDHRRHAVAVPVGVPVYYNPGYYPYEPAPAQVMYPIPATAYGTPAYQPAIYGSAPPAAQQSEPPVVIINQYFRGDEPPVTETAPQSDAAAQGTDAPVLADRIEQETVFMIAMKDHNVYTARAYWVEEGMLHYISTQGVESSVLMDEVDRDLSRRLNRDRSVAFGLPSN